jgi:hypothetical protein
MYTVRKDHGVLATPYGIWQEGEAFVPPSSLPREVLRNWMEQNVIVTDESGPDVEEIMDETDALTVMDRKQLISLISANKVLLGTIKPRTSWSEDVIRQAIRDIADLSALTFPVVSTEPPPV